MDKSVRPENDIPKTGSDGYKQIANLHKKIFPAHPMYPRSLFPYLVCGLLFIGASRTPAANDPLNSALPAAQAWLAMIDAGNYEGSYAAAGEGLHQVTPQNRWELTLKTLRPPWGPLVSRKMSKYLYQPNGIKGLNGECMVIAYDTSFKRLTEAEEMVILRYEDGKWRGVGYTAGPRPPPPGTEPFVPADSAAQSTTSGTVHATPQ